MQLVSYTVACISHFLTQNGEIRTYLGLRFSTTKYFTTTNGHAR